eukprot:1683983-Rhodomonas_salina.1
MDAGCRYKDGMLVVPDGYLFDDVPGLSNLPSPSGKVKRDNVCPHLFSAPHPPPHHLISSNRLFRMC